jgi:aspartyl-tRNA(Asn)/glutamyl-tRNA(Gln) amidotransferase subunit B
MRSKEDAQDYRYFPDPDLPPLAIGEDWIERVRASLPELPATMRARFERPAAPARREYGLSPYEASALTASRELAGYYEDVVAASGGSPRIAASWMMGELSAALRRGDLEISASPVPAASLGALLKRMEEGAISGKTAKEVFDAMWSGEHNGDPDAIISARGLQQISDSSALESIVDQVLAAQPAVVEEFRSGREKAFNALVGQAMKATRGKANPAELTAILRKKLGSV